MVNKNIQELKNNLKEQMKFLIESSRVFDTGFIEEAKKIAVTLRVLLHDTRNSTSLLKHLGKKDTVLFYNTAIEYSSKNKLGAMGLIMLETDQYGFKYIAPLGNGAPLRYKRGKMPFTDWWNEIVFDDGRGSRLTRMDLVLEVANKDGGAHIATNFQPAYIELTRSNSLGFVDEKGNKLRNAPALVSLRQIAYEVLHTFKDEFPDCF